MWGKTQTMSMCETVHNTQLKFCPGMTKYLKKGLYKYSNRQKKTPWRNMQIYLKDWKLLEQIFKHISGRSCNNDSSIFGAQIRKCWTYALKSGRLRKKWNKTKEEKSCEYIFDLERNIGIYSNVNNVLIQI